jgi:hypothetical protein
MEHRIKTVKDMLDIDDRHLISKLIPDFGFIEYNSYTRLPYSINTNTFKICIPMKEDSYKLLYSELPTVYDVLKGKVNLNF